MQKKSQIRLGILTTSISRQSGGLLSAVSSQAVFLSKLCCQVNIFSGRDSDTDSDLKYWNGLSTNILVKKGPPFLSFMPALNSELRKSKIDILHVHGIWMYPSIAASLWSKLSNKKYIVSPHGMLDYWALCNSKWKKKIAGQIFENRHLRNASCIHALCESEYKSIRDYGLKNPVAIIPNGVEIPMSHESTTKPAWAGSLVEGNKILLFLGRIHPKKGLVNLLNAWSQVYVREPSIVESWKLVIAGWDQDNHQMELQQIVKNLGITKNVRFVGPQFNTEKENSLAIADAFILPSYSEGLPMSVLEAWSYNLPVLMSRQCNLSEGFDYNSAIEIATNSESICDGLLKLFNMTENERISMGHKGRGLVEEHFNWSVVSAEMCAVYKWVLGLGEIPKCVITD